MMNLKISLFVWSFILIAPVWAFTQNETFPDPPEIKSYKGIPGKVTKYNNFNFLDIKDENGKNNRQAMGRYWEINYSYDSAFRQKRKFKEFVVGQIIENKGSIFFQDTLQVHFVIPSATGNIWGRLVLSSDRIYRMRLIREMPFENKIVFDTRPIAVFDKYLDSIPLPPRINYLPKSVITRIQHSKYDHQEFTWNVKDTLYQQKVMGPYWDIKIDVKNSKNLVDKQVSVIEVLESYYRAASKAGGFIVKSRPRELLFTLPMDKALLWCRVTVLVDGVYNVRALIQSDQDKMPPGKLVSVPSNAADSTRGNPER